MSMDVSSLNSINSLLGSTYGTAAAAPAITSATSFDKYLMNALGTTSTTPASSVNSLLDMYSNGGASSLVSGLTGSGSTSDVASQLLSSLQSSGTGTSSADLTSLFNTQNTSPTATYADGLASSFQSQLLNNMNAAKAKLQSSFDGYIERMGENPTASAQFRIEQMQQNISLIENYIASKSTTSADGLLGQLTGTDSTKATNDSLVNQLDAKSALTQHMLNL